MAIEYPLALPSFGVVSCQRQLQFRQALRPNFGGTPSTVDLGTPLWKVRYETGNVSDAGMGEWEAFIASLRGSLGSFKATHPGRKWPIGNPTGWDGAFIAGTSTVFTGSGTIDNVSIPLSRVRLTGLPENAGFTPGLLPGDVISIDLSGGGRQLFQVTEGSSSGATGLATFADLIPSVTSRVVNGASYTILDPWFEAQLVPGSLAITHTLDKRSLSFEAIQVIR